MFYLEETSTVAIGKINLGVSPTTTRRRGGGPRNPSVTHDRCLPFVTYLEQDLAQAIDIQQLEMSVPSGPRLIQISAASPKNAVPHYRCFSQERVPFSVLLLSTSFLRFFPTCPFGLQISAASPKNAVRAATLVVNEPITLDACITPMTRHSADPTSAIQQDTGTTCAWGGPIAPFLPTLPATRHTSERAARLAHLFGSIELVRT
ncbi:hypothetical protein B0T20DRAFT_505629 [Sordaria brevicollis]|uniref:Uncharacterized protein n=1 Tax=Sordaria brevicollis TaxID=83679 RepID=A0AAE0UD48_SORBR|nr:hypothetical protein B0T20DRAFT_505629 [Sordaria brevicollis]